MTGGLVSEVSLFSGFLLLLTGCDAFAGRAAHFFAPKKDVADWRRTMLLNGNVTAGDIGAALFQASMKGFATGCAVLRPHIQANGQGGL
ncbi:hypothetical protein PX860_27135 (plasmid) [Agrobacterium leguminum]|uniref:hypothetical protein n=1 Tax=Agrobacterium leguminum TaxID=2792015 RepID=UPI00272A7290|nr:hypothetical protein [Agrobacterium leguminum]WLE00559.1 hypothetical protein PX860_27135 [Agrobacterium leguminum]